MIQVMVGYIHCEVGVTFTHTKNRQTYMSPVTLYREPVIKVSAVDLHFC